jgi:hypothetical protein
MAAIPMDFAQIQQAGAHAIVHQPAVGYCLPPHCHHHASSVMNVTELPFLPSDAAELEALVLEMSVVTCSAQHAHALDMFIMRRCRYQAQQTICAQVTAAPSQVKFE